MKQNPPSLLQIILLVIPGIMLRLVARLMVRVMVRVMAIMTMLMVTSASFADDSLSGTPFLGTSFLDTSASDFSAASPAKRLEPGEDDGRDTILPVEEAFRFGSYHEKGTINLFWQVMPGYFLYRDKIELSRDGKIQPVELPEGELRQDEVFGEVQVLDGLVELQTDASAGEDIIIRYQGCAAEGYCYPPQEKSLNSLN